MAQFTPKQQSEIDSINRVINHVKHDSILAASYVSLSEIMYIRNLDTLKYLNDKASAIAKKNLLLKLNEDEIIAFKNILSSAVNNIGYFYHIKGDLDKALTNYQVSLGLSEELDDKEGIAMAFINIGALYQGQGDIINSLEAYQKSVKLLDKEGDRATLAAAFNNMGYIYKSQGDVIRGLEYYHKALVIYEELHDKNGIAICLTNIGALYYSQGESDKGLEYYFKSLEIHKQIGSKKGMAYSLNNIGDVYKHKGESENALVYYEKSLKLRVEIGYAKGKADSYLNIGEIYFNDKNFVIALMYFQKSLNSYTKAGYKIGEATSLNSLAWVYFKQGKLLLARQHANESMVLGKDIGFPGRISAPANLLSSISRMEGKWKDAYDMQVLNVSMSDSLRNLETEKSVMRKQVKYEIDNKEQELELLGVKSDVQKLKLKRNSDLVILFSGLLGISLVLVFFGFRSKKRKRVINDLLLKQNEAKAVIIKEIHHRVKNNLQVVNSLLRSQSRGIEDGEIVEMFKIAQNRVVSMAILHEKMYQTDVHEQVNVKGHFEQLVRDLIKAYKVDTEIDLEFDIAPIRLDMETLVPLGLIVNELITNSLKYAFKDKTNGIIYLKLQKKLNDSLEMIIGDNGSGIGIEINTESDHMGTKIIQTFVKQLNGTIDLLDEPGTNFRLNFNLITI